MYYGNPTPDAERLGFRIQDYPKNTSSYPSSPESASIFALTANLMWSAPGWQPQGDTLTLDTLHAPRTVSTYGYYFAVLETQTNPQGQTYASRVRVDVLIDSISHSEQMIPYQKSMGIQSLLFSSTDGLTFHLDSLTPNLGSLKYNWNNPTQNGFCAAGGWGEGAHFITSDATLTLNPASEQAELSANFNGEILYSYYNENIPDHPYACRLISNQTGSGAVNLNMTFHVDFERETPPHLDLKADPEIISPANQDGEFDQATLTVDATTNKPWTLTIEGHKPGEPDSRGLPTKGDACTWSSSGEEAHKEVPFVGKCNDGTYMVDGAYTAKLESDGLEKTAAVKIDNTPPVIGNPLIKVLPDGSVNYTAEIYDPIVNGIAAGLDENSLDLTLLKASGESISTSNISLKPKPNAPGKSLVSFNTSQPTEPFTRIRANDKVANADKSSCKDLSDPEKQALINEMKLAIEDMKQVLRKAKRTLGLPDSINGQSMERLLNEDINDFANGGFSIQSGVDRQFDRLSGRIETFANMLDRAVVQYELRKANLEVQLSAYPTFEEIQSQKSGLEIRKNNLTSERDSVRNSNLPREEKLSRIEQIKNQINQTNDQIQSLNQQEREVQRLTNQLGNVIDDMNTTTHYGTYTIQDFEERILELADELMQAATCQAPDPSPPGCFKPCNNVPNFPSSLAIIGKDNSILNAYPNNQCLDFMGHNVPGQPEPARFFQDEFQMDPPNALCTKIKYSYIIGENQEPKTKISYQETKTNLEFMQKGEAPCERGATNPPTGNSQNVTQIHHFNQDPDGPFAELSSSLHRLTRHPRRSSLIDRPEFNKMKEKYWKTRAAQIEFGNDVVACPAD